MAEGQPRNADSALLISDEGGITDQLVICLQHIFAKYCTPGPERTSGTALLTPPTDAYFSEEGLQRWARETNGEPFSEETKEEVVESFDVNDDGNLTFRGFLQLYQLQTENDEAETWKDLVRESSTFETG
ncbi:hypothetical protein CVT25_012593 [Psilocybe cyanescens]|uniref:EF-hand domain-containing protein n=1 Tax=Psilocybe cyanescens TaxID=93625 RepID=A0A409X845_PSICY|nr:hypothetical protein CVT25_012593 [Psilocybe cyanescens]